MLDAALLGLLAAFFFSLNLVLMRRCLQNVDLIKGTFVVTCVALPILAAVCVASGEILNLGLLDPSTILLLGVGGALHFVLGRTLQYSSAKTVGATRAMTLTSTNVIYSPILGVLILSETMTPQLLSGTICIIIGSWIILLSTRASDVQPKKQAHSIRGIAFGLAGGAVWGITPIFEKFGVLASRSALLSIFVAMIFAAVSCLAFLLGARRHKGFGGINKNNLILLILAGACVCFAQLSRYLALSMAGVSLVEPVIGATPLLTLVLAFVFLRRIEKINAKTIVGILLSTVGIYAVLI